MMPKPKLLLALVASAAIVGPAALAAPVAEGGQKFSMVLTDEAEVPGPGDPNASGTANVIINPGQARICWEITTANVNPAYTVAAGTGAHIHRGAITAAGPIVVHFAVTLNGTNTGCVDVPRALIEEIRKNPDRFYVNVHWRHPTDSTQNFSAGALRAQLTKNQLIR
jgi:CHRD domain